MRQVARWITGLPARLDPADAEHPHDIHPLPRARPAVRHVAWFARVIKHLSGDQTLTTWMNTLDAELPVLHLFTTGLRRSWTPSSPAWL